MSKPDPLPTFSQLSSTYDLLLQQSDRTPDDLTFNLLSERFKSLAHQSPSPASLSPASSPSPPRPSSPSLPLLPSPTSALNTNLQTPDNTDNSSSESDVSFQGSPKKASLPPFLQAQPAQPPSSPSSSDVSLEGASRRPPLVPYSRPHLQSSTSAPDTPSSSPAYSSEPYRSLSRDNVPPNDPELQIHAPQMSAMGKSSLPFSRNNNNVHNSLQMLIFCLLPVSLIHLASFPPSNHVNGWMAN